MSDKILWVLTRTEGYEDFKIVGLYDNKENAISALRFEIEKLRNTRPCMLVVELYSYKANTESIRKHVWAHNEDGFGSYYKRFIIYHDTDPHGRSFEAVDLDTFQW